MTSSDTAGQLPAGHRLVTFATRPDLIRPCGDFNSVVWAEFMLHDRVANDHWHHMEQSWPELQLVLLDADDTIVATGCASPLVWDGTDDGLPGGWDDQLLRAVADHEARRVADTLGAIQIVVDPARQGSGVAAVMIQGMRALARERRMRAVIACVRPTWKERYPLTPVERYATWRREDGLPFDPWIRLHERLGGRVTHASPRSMTIEGTVAEWESWTGMAYPESGDYVVPGAASVVTMDRDADLGTYHDPNVWIIHDLTGETPADTAT